MIHAQVKEIKCLNRNCAMFQRYLQYSAGPSLVIYDKTINCYSILKKRKCISILIFFKIPYITSEIHASILNNSFFQPRICLTRKQICAHQGNNQPN